MCVGGDGCVAVWILVEIDSLDSLAWSSDVEIGTINDTYCFNGDAINIDDKQYLFQLLPTCTNTL